MKERVLITGASGFVGYHLVQQALQKNLEVFAAVRPSSRIDHLQSSPVNFTALAFDDPGQLERELKRHQYQYIIHAAGLTRAKTQQDYDRVNADFSRNLAASAMASGVPLKKFVFISSLAALGPLKAGDTTPISSSHPPHPVTAYGKSKLLAEKYLAEIPGLPLTVIRPTAVYGPRERDLFILINTIANGFEPYIGRNKQQLSFVYVKDLAEIVVNTLTKTVNAGNAYNISDGAAYDKYRFGEITRKLLDKRTVKFHIPLVLVKGLAFFMEKAYTFSSAPPVLNQEKMHELTAENWVCSIAEAKEDLDFVPKYNLESGLEETIKWYRENKWLN
ncbi:NAD-dependent epimerase/dehydratase family protein [Hufsiella ginkgonis]|uniref:NAD-dependent epimerase/dehydratase family protein n=1 Tax=Hufsiella ginkgonis TaxID=2695274 RepID=A0A7K1XZ12_9SPHI|nr:NAD(P)-dependent oxidoreductase [Hufsiella ginkgonis]MXV16244.1 NAD-dependent epimerase/dehydratase family protein [Hufsiella ginkgonis]